MKNIYQDDSFSKDSNDDIFSKTSSDLIREFNAATPQKPKNDLSVDFTENTAENKTVDDEQKTVHPAKQAPPPIKKSVPSANIPQPSQGAVYAPGGAYPQNPYYPQPVYYQPDPNQPYPVFVAPGQPYPVYPQAPGYPVQPAAYPPMQGGYVQQPYYPQSPVMQAPPASYPPVQGNFTPPAPQPDPLNNEAGTRVLFQSPDFDKKEGSSADEYETLPHTFSPSAKLDITEVELPSRKRAGTPSESAAYRPSSFKIDEMEIGTYELNAMTINRSVKVTGVEAPTQNKEAPEVIRPNVDEEIDEKFDAETGEEASVENGASSAAPNAQAITANAEKTPTEPVQTNDGTKSDKKKKKKLSGKEIVRRIVLCVSFVLIVVSLGMLYNEYRLHKENEKNMSNISDLIITEESTTEPTTEEATTASSDAQASATTTTKPTTTRYLTPSEQFELLKKENPDINFPANIQYKYAKLYAENQDFVGYLSVKGTDIDFPIVQGKDDEEYLEKNFFGEYTKYGCPFMTSRNNPEILDMNTVIYGHHMRDGSLFATLDQYTTLEGFKEAPIISFNTLYQDFNFKVIAVMITNVYPEDDNGYVFPYTWTNLNNTLNYTAYLNQLAQRSLYDTGVDVLPTDRILTLSTCCSEFTDARFVVVARLVRPGESTEVDTSKAVENPNPRYPQAYYDEYNMTNPYANAYRWEIT